MKRIVITGCSRGIGRATAEALVDDGHTVIGLVRRPDQVPAGVTPVACDLEDPHAIRRAARAIAGEPVDVLIHNAGLFLDTVQHTRDGIERMWAVHVLGPLLLTRLLTSDLRGGRVVFVSSTAYLRGSLEGPVAAGQIGYRRAKLGQVAVARALAHELADRGIRCVALHPGVVKTDIGSRHTSGLMRLGWRVLRSFGTSPARAARTVRRVALDPTWQSQTDVFYTPAGPQAWGSSVTALDAVEVLRTAEKERLGDATAPG